MEEIVAEHTGQPLERVTADLDRDFILTAEEAKAYGVVDGVVSRKRLVPVAPALAAGAGADGAVTRSA
jgi:ATP-dependent Clp protease protease subunit